MFDEVLVTRSTLPQWVDLDPLDPINDGLMGRWPTLEGGGTVVQDISPYRRHAATANGPGRSATRRGRGLLLNGSNQRASGIWSSGYTGFSVSCWFSQTTGTGGNRHSLFNTCQAGANAYQGQLFTISDDGTQLSFWPDTNAPQATASVSASLGVPVHYGISYDNNAKTARFYRNGVYVGGGGLGSSLLGSTTQFGIGLYNLDSPLWHAKGILSNVAAWARSIQPSEFARLYREPWAGTIEPASRLFHVVRGASSAPFTATPSAGLLTFAGATPNISGGALFSPNGGSLSFVGSAPTLSLAANINASTGGLVLQGLTPSLELSALLNAATGALTLQGLAPSVELSALLNPGAGSLLFGGQTPSLVTSIVLDPSIGAITLQGNTPSIAGSATINPANGEILWQGNLPVISGSALVTPGEGALVFLGYAPRVGIPVAVVVNPDRIIVIPARSGIHRLAARNRIIVLGSRS